MPKVVTRHETPQFTTPETLLDQLRRRYTVKHFDVGRTIPEMQWAALEQISHAGLGHDSGSSRRTQCPRSSRPVLRQFLCALTVVIFAACTGNRHVSLDPHGAESVDAPSLPKPVASPVTPSEVKDANDGVGPGMTIFESNPAANAQSEPAIPAAPPTTIDRLPDDLDQHRP